MGEHLEVTISGNGSDWDKDQNHRVATHVYFTLLWIT